jgi:hypothetical protein
VLLGFDTFEEQIVGLFSLPARDDYGACHLPMISTKLAQKCIQVNLLPVNRASLNTCSLILSLDRSLIGHLKKSHEKHSPLRTERGGSTETIGTGYWDD